MKEPTLFTETSLQYIPPTVTKSISFSDQLSTSTERQLLNIQVEEIVLTRTSNTISSFNNTFKLLWESSSVQTFTLDVGNYNVNTLAAEIQTKLNTDSVGGSTWTVTYNTSTNNFTFASTFSGTWYVYFEQSGGFEDYIGLSNTVSIDSTDYIGLSSSSSTTNDSPDLFGPKIIYILFHKNGSTDYTILRSQVITSLISPNQYYSERIKPTIVCIDPSETYEISLRYIKKNNVYESFEFGPSNMIRVKFWNH